MQTVDFAKQDKTPKELLTDKDTVMEYEYKKPQIYCNYKLKETSQSLL